MKLTAKTHGPLSFTAAAGLAVAMCMLTAVPAAAIEVNAGDYDVYPPGANFALLYYQHAESSDYYVNGKKLSGNFDITTDIGLFRYDRPFRLGDNATIEANLIAPFGNVSTSGDAAALGSASGVGDLILSAPVKFMLDPLSRDVFSIDGLVYVPTGNYDQNKALNLGEHRWKGQLQLAYVRHFNATWAIDFAGDVLAYGKNDKFGPTGATLKQDPRYELQTHLRYNLSPAMAFSADLGHYWGGETEVNGIDQNDKLRTTYGRLGASYFFDPTTQLLGQIGRDLSVENGAKEKARLNLRFAKIF